MQRWEYLTATVAYPDAANSSRFRTIDGVELPDWKEGRFWESLARLGEQGWELVAIHLPREQFGNSSPDPIYIFKRPNEE